MTETWETTAHLECLECGGSLEADETCPYCEDTEDWEEVTKQSRAADARRRDDDAVADTMSPSPQDPLA